VLPQAATTLTEEAIPARLTRRKLLRRTRLSLAQDDALTEV